MAKVYCARKHRMIPVVPGLMLCECSSYGRMAYLKGAAEDARVVVEKAGGISVLRDRIEQEEQAATERRKANKANAADKVIVQG